MTTAQTLLSYRAAVERHRQVTEQLGSRKHEPYIIVDGKWAAVNAALDKHGASLLAFDGVQGVAIGWRRWRGVRIPQRALIVFVRSKLPDEQVRGAALPKTLTTDSTRVRVDVVQTGTFQRHSIRSGGDEIEVAATARHAKDAVDTGAAEVVHDTIGDGNHHGRAGWPSAPIIQRGLS